MVYGYVEKIQPTTPRNLHELTAASNKWIFRSHLSFGVKLDLYFKKISPGISHLCQESFIKTRLFGFREDSFHFFLRLIIFQSCNSLHIQETLRCFYTSWVFWVFSNFSKKHLLTCTFQMSKTMALENTPEGRSMCLGPKVFFPHEDGQHWCQHGHLHFQSPRDNTTG